MKRRTLIIFLVVELGLIVAFISFVLSGGLLHASIKKILPECEKAEYVTQCYVVEADGLTISNDYFSVKLPDGYKEREQDENVTIYEHEEKNITYAISDEPDDYSMTIYDPKYYEEKNTINGIKKDIYEEVIIKMGYKVPDSYGTLLYLIASLCKDDYDHLNWDNQRVFWVLANYKLKVFEGFSIQHYSRDEVGAIIKKYEGTNKYMIDLLDNEDKNIVYTIYVSGAEDLDVWKLLNSLEFQ